MHPYWININNNSNRNGNFGKISTRMIETCWDLAFHTREAQKYPSQSIWRVGSDSLAEKNTSARAFSPHDYEAYLIVTQRLTALEAPKDCVNYRSRSPGY